jgi:hypothetical protein
MIILFLLIFLLREMMQFLALYKINGGINCTQIRDYFGFWNVLDWINIICMIGFLSVYDYIDIDALDNGTDEIENHFWGLARWEASLYSIMALVTWINLLQYLRLY